MSSDRNIVVFLSHSHADRAIATKIQAVLEKHGARTYLDQDQIQAGDALPKRIIEGIKDCTSLLLFWSVRSSRSTWVRRELETALELKKKIVPYALDPTPLPRALEDLVFVEQGDETRANAALLRAIFGRDFDTAPDELFPGQWKALVEIPMVGQATYDLNLRSNGQVEGVFRMLPSGIVGGGASLFGAASVLTTPIPVHGTWTYDGVADMLTLNITAEDYGTTQTDTIRVKATGRERGEIQGSDLGGRLWTLSRSTERAAAARPSQPSSRHAEFATELQRQYEQFRTLSSSKRRAAEVVFIGTAVFAFKELGLPPLDIGGLTGSADLFQARVSDELLDFLVEEGLLRR